MSDPSPALSASVVDRALAGVSRWMAIAGGVILGAVVLATTASVAGRWLFGVPVPGDYEITEFGVGVAILLFFPWCELSGGNIKAEFFTARAGPRLQALLDLAAEVAFLAIAALLCWRFAAGGLIRFDDGQTYLHLGIPIWLGYVVGVSSMAVLLLVCIRKIRGYYADLRGGGS